MIRPWLNKAGAEMIKSTASALLPFRKATLTWNHSIERGRQKFLKKSNLPKSACPFHAKLVWYASYISFDRSQQHYYWRWQNLFTGEMNLSIGDLCENLRKSQNLFVDSPPRKQIWYVAEKLGWDCRGEEKSDLMLGRWSECWGTAAPGDGKDPKVCMAQQSTGSQTAKLLLQPGGRGEIHPNDKEKFNSGLTHFIHTLGHLGLLTNSAQGNYLEQV